MKSKLPDQLAELNKEQLIDLLLNFARDFEQVEQRLNLHFTKPDGTDELKQFTKLIRSYIKQNSETGGFVPYRRVLSALTGANMVLEKAGQAMHQGDSLRAVRISVCILHEMTNLLQTCDDSGGYVGDVIRECLGIVNNAGQIINSESIKDKKELFAILLKEIIFPGYEGWDDWQLSFLESAAELVDGPEARQTWEDCLAGLESKKKSDEYSHSFFFEHAAMLRYQLIHKFDDSDRASEFLARHLEYPEFRQLAISDAITEKRYDDALRLAEEGEELDTDRRLPGLVTKWKNMRYEVYRLTGRSDLQRSLAEELASDGDYSFYSLLKELYSSHEWPDVKERILAELEKGGHGWHAHSLYTRLLVEENETVRLLRYVRKSISSISHYYPHLIEEYPVEVQEIFEQYIENEAASSSNRSDYQKVCKIIRQLINAGGTQKAKDIVQRLRIRYPKRPAMLDELQKIKGI